ncbi:ABC transporter ATP-binding protein [Actinomadura verrucosospora]|uniref:Putative ABC transporter, ATP-binding protein n=1 Tax=Actinomadura verrucosospora TaxID=46165 RepID=A0A7D3ZFT1_ACTVE|nr:ABC transporter ATP-binding protein [Actinomadura verrucosospora]QKG22357.1 putative ABC transporter, ATP-binding protein [Actinomadura verrucosospora]
MTRAEEPGTARLDGPEGGPPALLVRGLCKSFGGNDAVRDVDLTVAPGAFVGLVGPNGAGKTTLLSMAVGLLRPDAGNAWVAGAPVWPAQDADRAKALLGVLPDGLALPQRLTGPELLTYLGRLRGLPAPVLRSRVDELLDVLDLAAAGRTLIGDYSTGMRKKIGLAAALLHGPRLLVLDEPFEAVDPVSAAVVRAILDGFVAGGGTVLMSSHAMALVERLCDHVAVLDRGVLLRAGTLDQVRSGHTLEEAFAELVGARPPARGLSWFGS